MTTWINRLRLASGLFLFAFMASHLVNHALGILSLEAMSAGLTVFRLIWSNPISLTLLSAAVLVHVAIAVHSIWRRRTLKLSPWQWAQTALGFAIPLLLVGHVTGTAVARAALDVDPTYAYVQTLIWTFSPIPILEQTALLSVAWAHGVIGIHFWLRLKPWYGRALPWLYAAAVALPVAGFAGFVASGIAVSRLAETEGFRDAVLAGAGYSDGVIELVVNASNATRLAVLALVGGAFAARGIRTAIGRRRGGVKLYYRDDKVVEVEPGSTALDAIRRAGIPHAMVCGGRGRCSTCRVRVNEGIEFLEPPSPAEAKVLARIGATPEVRLACQIKPVRDIVVTPLLPATASPRDGFARPDYLQGQEREIAVLFADLRNFTRLSEQKLPFDVVFLLNRYFAAMGQAIEREGGRLDKFIGDGVMALFGVEAGPAVGSRRALAAARAMAVELETLNRSMANDLTEPLRLGIGIHVGQTVVGEMGWGTARGLTAIGDTVNTASRLESMTKEFAVQLVLSEPVGRHAGLDLDRFPRHEVEIRGRAERLIVHAVERALDLPELAGAWSEPQKP